MAGFNQHNYPVFNAEAKRLRALGYMIINPAEINPLVLTDIYTEECYKYLKKDLNMILNNADALLVMPGWEFSYGCNAEVSLAKAIKLPIYNINLTIGDGK
jgi:hypothetical protein